MDRIERQKQFRIHVTILFLAFCIIAAPLQFHFDWYSLARNGEASWLNGTLKSGILFFYATTLCVEALFRLTRYPTFSVIDYRITALKIGLLIPIIAFIFEFFVTSQYQNIGENSISSTMMTVQIFTAFVALALSTIVHYIVTNKESKTIR